MTADVTARLADGASAVANTATYVAARRAGVSPQTVRDSYSAEDGMRLADLDADGAALTGAAVAGDEAIRAARDALTTLREAWQGPAAAAAVGAVVGGWTALSGRPVHRFLSPLARPRTVWVAASMLVAAWAWKIAAVRGGGA